MFYTGTVQCMMPGTMYQIHVMYSTFSTQKMTVELNAAGSKLLRHTFYCKHCLLMNSSGPLFRVFHPKYYPKDCFLLNLSSCLIRRFVLGVLRPSTERPRTWLKSLECPALPNTGPGGRMLLLQVAALPVPCALFGAQHMNNMISDRVLQCAGQTE